MPYDKDSSDDDGDTVYHIYRPSKNKELALYAKADSRMRIEYRYKENPKKICSDMGGGRFLSGDLSTLPDFMVELCEKAAQGIEPLREAYITYDQKDCSRAASIAADISAIGFIAAGDAMFLAYVLKHMSGTGKISEKKDDPDFNSKLFQLAERGLLRPHRKKPNKARSYTANGGLKKLVNFTTSK